MTVLRVFPGANNQNWQILSYLKYVVDEKKHFWGETKIPSTELIQGYGISVDPVIATSEILGLHQVFGNPGTRYFYHLLIDFSAGSVDPWKASAYGWEITEFLRERSLQYLQGVHCVKGQNIFHPHLHIIINAMRPLTGTKLHIGFDFIRNFKIFTNYICYKHKVPLIVLGQASLPFYIRQGET